MDNYALRKYLISPNDNDPFYMHICNAHVVGGFQLILKGIKHKHRRKLHFNNPTKAPFPQKALQHPVTSAFSLQGEWLQF